jgi:hypothetical protein
MNMALTIMNALHWGVAAFDASSKGDGQHNCSTEHGHHSKEPNGLFLSFLLLARPLIYHSAHFG